MDGSPWLVGHETVLASVGLAGLLTSQMAKPAKLPAYAESGFGKLSPASESNAGGLGVNETSRMFLAVSPASNRPAFRPTRGSLDVGNVCADSLGAVAKMASADRTADAHGKTTCLCFIGGLLRGGSPARSRTTSSARPTSGASS